MARPYFLNLSLIWLLFMSIYFVIQAQSFGMKGEILQWWDYLNLTDLTASPLIGWEWSRDQDTPIVYFHISEVPIKSAMFEMTW